jgi:hypothetical protein
VQHEVLAAPGSTPRDVVFILDGHADVAVRAAADSSELTVIEGERELACSCRV